MVIPKKELNHLYTLLIVIMFFKIAGFFTISENVAITRVLKIFIRLCCTVSLIFIFNSIQQKYGVASFTHKNRLSILFYIAYFALGIYSLLWTSDVMVTTLQLVMDIELLIFSYVFIKLIVYVNHFDQDKQALRMSFIMAFAIFLILVVMVVGKELNPDKFFRLTHGGDVARLGGFMMNPNELGMLSVVGAGMCFVEFPHVKKKLFTIIMLGILIYGLVLTQSRSSMIGFMLITYLFIKSLNNKAIKIGMYACMVAAIPVIVSTIFIKMGDVEEVLSMTGRLPFWDALLNEALPQEPYLGFGFMRIYYGDYFEGVHTYAAKMTHNTFVQVLLNLGLVGGVIVLLQMFHTLRGVSQSKDKNNIAIFWGMFIPAFINSLTEFGIFGETNFGILFYQLLILLFVVEYDSKLTTQQRITNKIRENSRIRNERYIGQRR